jgi:mono/diheme cytochrome c family protein
LGVLNDLNPLTEKIRAVSAPTRLTLDRARHTAVAFKFLPFRFLIVALSAFALLGALGCYDNNTGETTISGDIRFKLPAFPETGSNKIQVFTEMHYQPSYRTQEGPRLTPPDGAVPISGAEVVYTSVEDYKSMSNPGGDANRGVDLFTTNCTVCHGPGLKGDGIVTTYGFTTIPADLTAELTRNRTDGELFGIISFGGNTAFASRVAALTNPNIDPNTCVNSGTCPMPEFRKLLSESERWDLVSYIRSQQGR